MKQLDEMERMAREHLDNLIAIYGRLPPPQGSGDRLAHALAEFVCAAMPVVRATLSQPGCIFPGCELENAIDEMRRRLGGE